MSYRTHLTLTARHTGLNLGGTRTLAHATTPAYAIHGASILRFRPDSFRSVDGVSDWMSPGNSRVMNARPTSWISGSAAWDDRLKPEAPWSRSVAAVQKPQQPLQTPHGLKSAGVVVRNGIVPVVRGVAALMLCRRAARPGGTAELRGEREGTE
jgi:hypothetical protein